MLPQLFTFLLWSALQVTASPYKPQTDLQTTLTGEECPTLHIVTTRGTLEITGAGAMRPLVETLLADVPGSTNESTIYPAGGIKNTTDGPVYNGLNYSISVQKGRTNLSAILTKFYDRCPSTGIVLMGYSQGAHITGDVLCGSTFPFFLPWTPIDKKIKANVVAVITLGDPRNNKHYPEHGGNSTNAGLFPRTSFLFCTGMVPKWKTYCDANDIFCDHGKEIDPHLHYVEEYHDDIIEYVKGKISTLHEDL